MEAISVKRNVDLTVKHSKRFRRTILRLANSCLTELLYAVVLSSLVLETEKNYMYGFICIYLDLYGSI